MKDKILISGVILMYLCYFISTVLRLQFLLDLFSPLCDFAVALAIFSCIKDMGKFKFPALVLSLGIFSYMASDILLFLDTHILNVTYLEQIYTFGYLLPNYLFGASVAMYFLPKLKGRELYHFLMNTLTLTVIGFVSFRRLLIYLGSYQLLDQAAILRVFLYFVINLYILIMSVHMLLVIKSKTWQSGTYIMVLGILGYILLDVPYTYLQAIDQNPENIYTNLIYALCMIVMSCGVLYQTYNKIDFELDTYKYNKTTARRTGIVVLSGIIISIILAVTGVIERNELFYLLISMLAYWITTSTFHNTALNEQLLKQQDILTGLYNRRYCLTVLDELIKSSEAHGRKFAIFCIDLNCFKPVNDTYGHDMGDRVLKEYGDRMLNLPAEYTSFRTGGDEFTIIKDNVSGKTDVTEAAKMLHELFHQPMNIDNYTFNLSGSIGVAVYPDDATDYDKLIRYADTAMYTVKHSSNKDDYRLFDSALIESAEKQKALEEKLKASDLDKDFVLFYQPRFDAKDECLVEIETFPRLVSDENNGAEELLPIAEEIGLMGKFGNWIIETAIKQLRAWEDAYGLKVSIAINLSPLQILEADFLTNVKELTKRYDFTPSRIHFDISNESVMSSSTAVKETLKQLHQLGYPLALNKFGGGDINLNHIMNCGFSTIHLSPSIIRSSEIDEIDSKLIESIIALCDSLGLSSYAVGIETKEQKEKLKALGVKCLQGYLLGKPVDAGDFARNYIH